MRPPDRAGPGLTDPRPPRTLRRWPTSRPRQGAGPSARSRLSRAPSSSSSGRHARRRARRARSGCSSRHGSRSSSRPRRSGAGKSTLLGALLDFLPPDVRVVELAGRGRDVRLAARRRRSSVGRASLARCRGDGAGPGRRRPCCSPPSCPITCPPTPGEPRPGSPSGPRRSATAWRRRSMPTRSTTSSRRCAGRRSGWPTTSCRTSGSSLVLRRIDGGRRRRRRRPLRPAGRARRPRSLQRLGPAVLATWDPATDAFEHFGWGVTPELARRVGRRPGDFEIEVDRRRAYLDDLAAAGVTEPERARAAIRALSPGAGV